jgi:hypothetical protein
MTLWISGPKCIIRRHIVLESSDSKARIIVLAAQLRTLHSIYNDWRLHNLLVYVTPVPSFQW